MKSLVVTSVMYLFLLAPTAWCQEPQEVQEIPNDLEIRIVHGGTQQFGNYYTFTIRADGRVTIEYQSRGLPIVNHTPLNLRVKGQPKPPDPPKKKKRLSRSQLGQILHGFQSSGFITMRDNYWGDPKVERQSCINHAEAKGLSILADGKKKEVSFFLGCSYDTVPEFKTFNELFDTISALLSTVRITEVRTKGN